jgi:hypothetical protein
MGRDAEERERTEGKASNDVFMPGSAMGTSTKIGKLDAAAWVSSSYTAMKAQRGNSKARRLASSLLSMTIADNAKQAWYLALEIIHMI